MNQIVGLTDVGRESIAGIKDEILAMGADIGKGPQELAEAFYFVASAGFAADEAMEVLRTSAMASAAGLGETQTIAQVLGGVINAYGKENITAARAADILTEAVSQGTAEAAGFAAVIGNVVPGAAALGVSFDQVTAAMAGMTLSGVGVEESATSLINIFSSLQKPTAQAEAALEEMGLSSAELRRQLREEGLLATLRTLEERFAGNETASAAVFGNIRALRGVTALLGLDTEQLNSVFEKVYDSQGRLVEAYGETEGSQRELDRAMAELQATAIELGADVLPVVIDVLKQAAGGAREFAKWWRSLDDDTKRLIVQLAGVIAIAGPLLSIVGKLTSGLGGMLRVVAWLTGTSGLPALIAKAGGARVALGGLALGLAAFTSAAANNELNKGLLGVRDFAERFGKSIGPFGRDAAAFNKALHHMIEDAPDVRLAMEGIYDQLLAFEAAGATFQQAWRAVQDGLSVTDWETHRDEVDAARLAWEGLQGSLGPSMADAATEAALIAAGVPPEIASIFSEGGPEVGGGADEMVDPVAVALEKARADAAVKAQGIIDALAGTLATGPDQIAEEMQAILDALTNPYAELPRRADLEASLAVQLMQDAIDKNDPALQARVFEQVNAWLGQYDLLEPGALERGELVNPAFQDGINSNLQAALDWYQTNVADEFASLSDIADQLDRNGYSSLAAYARGVDRANRVEMYSAIARFRNDASSRSELDLWGQGNRAGNSWVNGYMGSLSYAQQQFYAYASTVRGILPSSEPKDPRSPWRGITTMGASAAMSIVNGWVGTAAAAHAAVSRWAAAMVPALGGGGGLFLDYAGAAASTGVLSPAATAEAGGSAGNAGTTIINNRYLTLSVAGKEREVRDEYEAVHELKSLETVFAEEM